FGTKTGVLLVNLGTPTAPTPAALRPYLRQFLSDPRVVELPRWLWIPLLYGLIVPLRAPKSAHAYASIWDKTHNASPLKVITESQTRKLDALLPREVLVRYAMRYGNPSIPQMLSEMTAQGCSRIVVMPLYPQYAGATVGTVMDEIARWIPTQRWVPTLQVIPPYYDNPAYISALAQSVVMASKAWPSHPRKPATNTAPQVLLASFHGMPLKACQDGDVYYCHCHKTARLLAKKLGVPFCKTIDDVLSLTPTLQHSNTPPLLLTFQSRFGKAEWLKPYFADVIEQLPKAGITRAAVISPAFAADCVETLEELAIAGRESFLSAGGTHYTTIPCLNDSDDGMAMLHTLLKPLL
ncbi:MAG: ferrochelatase, partial [Alphaproteobacteria bacterium]